MGLQLNKLTNFGVATTYYNLKITNIDWKERQSTVILNAYIDKASRLAGHTPLQEIVLSFNDADFFFTDADNIRKQAYDIIKTLEEWSEADDL